MEYSYAITFFLIGIISLFFLTQISSAQTVTTQLVPQQISSIDPSIAQEANKHTRAVDLCPPTNDPLMERCFGKVIVQDTLIPFASTQPADLAPQNSEKFTV